MNQNKNYDWILVDTDLEPFLIPVTFPMAQDELATEGVNMFSSGLVFNSQTFPRIDRLQPILPEDSTAPGMQHFPVIKDFAITWQGKSNFKKFSSVENTRRKHR